MVQWFSPLSSISIWNWQYGIHDLSNSRSCFCWLYRASPSLATKNIINLILVLTIFAQIHVHWVECHPNISSSIPPLHLLPSMFLSIRIFSMSWLFPSDGQSTKALASALLMNIKDWFPLELTAFISLLPKGLSRVFSSTRIQKYQFFHAQSSLWSNSHIHTWLLEKTIALPRQIFVSKVMSLLFDTLSRVCHSFSFKEEASFYLMAAVTIWMILEPKEIKSLTVSIFSPIYFLWSGGTRCHYLSFLNVDF